MKRFTNIIVLFVLCLLFTSCIDYVQTVSYKDGEYKLYYKVTLSKMLFEMADEEPEEVFDVFNDDTLRDLPENIKVQRVNTDLEVGGEFFLNINPKTTDETEKALLPTVAGKKCFIPFLIGNESNSLIDYFKDEDSESQEITKAILSSAKCKILIDKSVLPVIDIAYFEGRGGQNYSIALFDYGISYCLEIPFIVLFETGMYNFDRIVVIRG